MTAVSSAIAVCDPVTVMILYHAAIMTRRALVLPQPLLNVACICFVMT